MIKFIDAKTPLSIQVHPSNSLSKQRHNSLGKNEMWHVMQVGQYINRKDNRSIKKWLRDHRIPIHKDGRDYVFRIQVEQEVWRPFAEDLVKKYPNSWQPRLDSIYGNQKELHQLLYHDCLEFDAGFVPYRFNLDISSNKEHESIFQELYK